MKLAILIQSNDEYNWLWEGLFLTWKLNWNWDEFNYPLFLLTETKKFSECHKDCDFETINVGEDLLGSKNYSNKLLRALLKLKEEGYTHVLYSQDDSWSFTRPDTMVLKECFEFVKKSDLDCLYIHEHRSHFPFTVKSTDFKIQGHKIKKFIKGSRFFYNHGNAIWNIESLLTLQSTDEGPYQNECDGTERAWRTLDSVYIINIPWYDQDIVHEKGKIKETALNFLRDLRFRYAWENKPEFMYNYVAYDSSVIPKDPDDFKNLSDSERDNLYETNWGNHFSTHNIISNI